MHFISEISVDNSDDPKYIRHKMYSILEGIMPKCQLREIPKKTAPSRTDGHFRLIFILHTILYFKKKCITLYGLQFHLQPVSWVQWLEIKKSCTVPSCDHHRTTTVPSVQYHLIKFAIQRFNNKGSIVIQIFDHCSYSWATWPEIEKIASVGTVTPLSKSANERL